MPKVIRVRDIARATIHELGPEEQGLRGPYDLFHPIGAVRRRGSLIDWLEGSVGRTARVVPTLLGDVRPGERVLLQLRPGERTDDDDQWWLCEVEAVDGIAAAL